MEKYLDYIIPILTFALLTAGWMAVQLLAKKMKTKNYIDQGSGCCGACDKKDICSNSETR